jgi:Chlorophyll A-B binding protein
MQTGTENSIKEANAREEMAAIASNSTTTTPLDLAYNGIDRNAWIFGFNPQQELWNGRLAMIGFVAYLLWDFKGYSVLRDVLHFIR